jgi:hypothetical protein
MKMGMGPLMGKQQLGFAFLLILCVSTFATTATANAYSESFPLMESASVTKVIFANEGDRLVGNFTVSNIPTWIDSNNSELATVQYAFKVSKIEGSEQCPTDIVLYEVDQTEHGSFDVFCGYTANYRFRFNVGIGDTAAGIGSMRATLNYNVVKNSSYERPIQTPLVSDAPSNQESPGSGIETVSPLLAVVVVFIVILILGVVFVVTRAKGLSHKPIKRML